MVCSLCLRLLSRPCITDFSHAASNQRYYFSACFVYICIIFDAGTVGNEQTLDLNRLNLLGLSNNIVYCNQLVFFDFRANLSNC